jgi:hypothetical protein
MGQRESALRDLDDYNRIEAESEAFPKFITMTVNISEAYQVVPVYVLSACAARGPRGLLEITEFQAGLVIFCSNATDYTLHMVVSSIAVKHTRKRHGPLVDMVLDSDVNKMAEVAP